MNEATLMCAIFHPLFIESVSLFCMKRAALFSADYFVHRLSFCARGRRSKRYIMCFLISGSTCALLAESNNNNKWPVRREREREKRIPAARHSFFARVSFTLHAQSCTKSLQNLAFKRTHHLFIAPSTKLLLGAISTFAFGIIFDDRHSKI